LIDALYARRTNERFEQAHAVEKALGLRKRTRQTPIIGAEMENVHGIEAHPCVRRRSGAYAQHWAHCRLGVGQKAEDQERQNWTH
jgi:hypothetical protein